MGLDYVKASDLARLGYCERQVVFDTSHGRRTTSEQREARARGNAAHEAFYQESKRVAELSQRKGKCFIATATLGQCEETNALRAFRDLFLRRTAAGRFLIGWYYAMSPLVCTWLDRSPTAKALATRVLRRLGRLAQLAVARVMKED